MDQPIAENLWWIIPGKLGGVRKPTAQELSDLLAAGVGAIVSVMDDPANLDMYERFGIAHLWLPVKGGTAPTREQIAELSTFVAVQNAQSAGVAVHCTSGRRRTGTFLAAYLIVSGQSYEAALHTVLTANPEIELREPQLDFLRGLAEEF